MDSLKQVIFDDKTFSDLLKEIHVNQKKKGKQIGQLISELRPLIQNLGDATVVVPLIKEYMEISVKNDDHLLKMASIVQRLSTGNATGGGGDPGVDLPTGLGRARAHHPAAHRVLHGGGYWLGSGRSGDHRKRARR